tara:strand:+ start:9767 stop:12718 length:2952 start_codon:yes stop_codon:yes gene_type:complete
MVQLVVKSQVTSDQYFLDISDVSIKGNYSAKEIQDLGSQKSDFTQSFTLPFTTINNDFFSHFYSVVVSGGDFDSSIKCEATIYVDSNVVFEGYLQLLNVNNSTQYYEAVVFGTISNIASSLGESKLNELDLSDFNHVLSYDNVVDSWSGNVTYTTSAGQTGSEILYPIIDYGYGYTSDSITGPSATGGLMPSRLKPTINVKVLFERILSSIGYTVNSTFFATDFFAKQYMTIANEFQTVAYTYQDSFRVGLSTNQVISTTTVLDLDDDTSTNPTGDFFDLGGNFNNAAAAPYYDVPLTGYYQFKLNLGYEFSAFTTTVATVYMKKLNDASFSQEIIGPWNGSDFSIFNLATGNQNVEILSPYIALEGGTDEVYFEVYFSSATNTLTIYKDQSNVQLYLAPISEEGSTLDFSADNNLLPIDKQVDFVSSICSRYNLIIELDKDTPKQLNVEPAQDYYDAGSSVDWSEKLDRNSNVSIKPTNEYRKAKLNFKDLEDEDYLNTYWLDQYRNIYNSYELDLDGDFGQGSLEVKSIFSSFNASILPNHDIISGRFYKQEDGQYSYVKTKPKLFYYSGLKSCSTYKLWSQATGAATSFTQYPFCHHYSMASTMVTSTDEDIRFKSRYAFHLQYFVEQQTTTDTYSKCWRKYLNSIYSSDARVLIANFYLTPEDIAEFNYNDKIFIEDTYYRVNKISSYALGKNKSTQVELLKIVDNNSNDTIIIAGCNLNYVSSGLDGTTSWTNPNGSSATPTQQCCEVNNLTWNNNKCYWNIDTSPDEPVYPPVKWSNLMDVNSTGGIVELGHGALEIRTKKDGGTDVYLDGNIKQLGKEAGDGEVLTWSAALGKTTWAVTSNTPNLYRGVTTSKIYIKADQFKTWSDSSIQSYSRDLLGSIQPTVYVYRAKVYASTFVPIGYEVTAFNIYSSQNRSMEAYTGRTTSDSTTSRGSGTANTLQVITAWPSVEGEYFTLNYEIGASTDEIYGAVLDIQTV